MNRTGSSVGTHGWPARRSKLKVAVGCLAAALIFPLGNGAAQTPEPATEEARRLLAEAEQELTSVQGRVKQDLQLLDSETDKILVLFNKAASIADVANLRTKTLDLARVGLRVSLRSTIKAEKDARDSAQSVLRLPIRCPDVTCPSSTDDINRYREQLGRVRECEEAVNKEWNELDEREQIFFVSVARARAAADELNGELLRADLDPSLDP